MWKRFVDDNFVVIKSVCKEEFFNHINSIEEGIQFTVENIRTDGSMHFLDTLFTQHTLMEVCLPLYTGSQLTPTNNYNGIATMPHQLNTVSSACCSKGLKKCVLPNNHWMKNMNTYKKVLTTCKYPRWAFNRMKKRSVLLYYQKKNKNNDKNGTDNKSKSDIRRNYIMVPYTKGLSGSFKNLCRKHGSQVYLRGSKTIKDLLVAPQDKDHITKKSGIIYRYKYDRLECDEEYIKNQQGHLERGLENISRPFTQFMTTGASQVIPLHWIISV